MKITIEYDLNEGRDEYEYKHSLIATDMKIMIEAFRCHLRHRLKHEDMGEEEFKIYEAVEAKFYELIDENELTGKL